MRSTLLALATFATLISSVWLAACGSIVRSTEETSPPPHGSKMEGLVYWLPKGSIIVDGTWEKDTCSIKVGTLIEADTSSRWRLTRTVNHLFEDTVLLEVDPATGLLKSLNGISEDKSAAIVATALQAAGKAMTFAATADTKATQPPCPSKELTAPFHLKIPVEDVRGAKNNYCKTLKITGSPPSSTSVVNLTIKITRVDTPASSNGTLGKTIDNNVIVGGIVVRAPAPYQMTIEKDDSKPSVLGEQIFFLPDPERIYYVPLDRTPFVKNETKIALVNGVVQSVSVTRPSIILGIVGVPKTILEALIPLR